MNECKQLLGKVTMKLAGLRHDLNEVLHSVTEKPFMPAEKDILSRFAKLILQYNGPNAPCCDFVVKMKEVV